VAIPSNRGYEGSNIHFLWWQTTAGVVLRASPVDRQRKPGIPDRTCGLLSAADWLGKHRKNSMACGPQRSEPFEVGQVPTGWDRKIWTSNKPRMPQVSRTPELPTDYMGRPKQTKAFGGFVGLATKKSAAASPLAGTHGRTRRCCSRTQPVSGHERRRYRAQGLAAQRTPIGTDRFGPHPIPFQVAFRIDTPNGGARHDGHSELPQRPPTHSGGVTPFAARDSPNGPSELCDFCAVLRGCQWETSPTAQITAFFCGKSANPQAHLGIAYVLLPSWMLVSTRQENTLEKRSKSRRGQFSARITL